LNSIWYGVRDIPGSLADDELERLCELAKLCWSWTEVGVFVGQSFYAAGLYLPKGGLIQAVDVRLGTVLRAGQTFFTTCQQLVEVRPDLKIAMLRMDSSECSWAACQTDGVFIDGGHDYQTAKSDIGIWTDKAKFVLGHDYSPMFPGVVRAVDEAKEDPRLCDFKLVRTLWSFSVRG